MDVRIDYRDQNMPLNVASSYTRVSVTVAPIFHLLTTVQYKSESLISRLINPFCD